MKKIFIKIVTLALLLNLTACGKEKSSNIIATIPEASGISFCKGSKSLVVANDEGAFYELSLEGKVLQHHQLGDYDLEGVVCQKEHFIFAIEDGALLSVERKTLKSKRFKVKGQGFKISKKHGIEGITKIDDFYYLTIQSKKRKKSKILLVKLGKNYAKVVKTIHHRIIDSAGMEYHDKNLFIVSDREERLYRYDLKREKILKTIKLPKFAQEGVTFDNEGYIYFADDNGAVLKYLFTDL